ncbi:hypothetical protein CMV_022510 [Castanea mollissima]|uniref:Uncharacterized protein n=1 Tax=Castanea mollissima TaxID=60419 RepID=A0A8J4VJL5_9ROSI|nr:hypothetical protein CMV_022510 [Castanea mollissima]
MLPIGSTIKGTEDRLCEYRFEVSGDENDIPNWFNHQRDGNLISFWIGPEFPIIALCITFGTQAYTDYFGYHVFVSINNSEQTFEREVLLAAGSSRHLSFSGRSQSSLQELFRDLQLTDRNHVQILCKTFNLTQCPAPIVEKIGVHVECNCLSLQSGLGLPMDTENGSDLGSAFDSSNVDGFDLGSSSVSQLVTPQISLVKMDFSLYLHYDILRSDAEKDDCKSSKRHSYCVSGEENDQSFANNEHDERLMFSFGKLISRNIRICA